jgi:hypothetical protein
MRTNNPLPLHRRGKRSRDTFGHLSTIACSTERLDVEYRSPVRGAVAIPGIFVVGIRGGVQIHQADRVAPSHEGQCGNCGQLVDSGDAVARSGSDRHLIARRIDLGYRDRTAGYRCGRNVKVIAPEVASVK